MPSRAFFLFAYDIPSDPRRLKIARLMESVGERVQYSVFEAYLAPGELEKVLKKAGKVMDLQKDSLRVYFLCDQCRARVITKGAGRVTPPPSTQVI